MAQVTGTTLSDPVGGSGVLALVVHYALWSHPLAAATTMDESVASMLCGRHE